MTGPARACPSAPAAPGNTLLGVFGADGRLRHARTALPVDEGFLAAAGPRVEARMRFAGACVEGACAQWTGRACGVVERVLAQIGDAGAAAPLPPCTIRAECRWHHQRGAAACRACALVVTDAREAAL